MSELYSTPQAQNCGTSTGAGVTVPTVSTRTLEQIAAATRREHSPHPMPMLEKLILTALREAVADAEQKARAEYGEQLKPLFEKVRALEREHMVVCHARRAAQRDGAAVGGSCRTLGAYR